MIQFAYSVKFEILWQNHFLFPSTGTIGDSYKKTGRETKDGNRGDVVAQDEMAFDWEF